MDIYEKTVPVGGVPEEELNIVVLAEGRRLVAYRPEKREIPKLPDPAKPALEPEEYRTNEELLLTGQHIEQYRHATYLPDPYYLEGLKRDPGDIRLNNAYGQLLLRRGQFKKAEPYFRKAQERLTERNPNPYNMKRFVKWDFCLWTHYLSGRAIPAGKKGRKRARGRSNAAFGGGWYKTLTGPQNAAQGAAKARIPAASRRWKTV